MPFYDEAAHNAALDALWGIDHGPTMPDLFEVGLLDGDPSDGGAELEPDGGYQRILCTNNHRTWLPADGGQKVSVPLAFRRPTDAWSADAAYWGLYVDGVLWDYGALAEPLTVDGPSDPPAISIARYFDTQTAED